MEFYIVNHVDRPCERLVTALIKNKGLKYLHPELMYWPFMGLGVEATRVNDFGFDITPHGNIYHFKKVRESIAKYRNGEKRQWQGKDEFSLTVRKGEIQ